MSVSITSIIFIIITLYAVSAHAIDGYGLAAPLPYGALAGATTSTEERKVDEQSIIAEQKKLTTVERNTLKSEDMFRLELITAPHKIDINSSDNKALKHLLERSWATAAASIYGARLQWRGSRPVENNPAILDLASPVGSKPEPETGFPAAHPAMLYTLSGVLSLVNIDWQRDAFATADAISARRKIAGLHYSKDLQGGRDLGYMLLGAMAQDTSFKNDLIAARKEYWSKQASTKGTQP
jgi:hypothetical protein